MAAKPNPLALYVHWPFCAAKCPYCDFNSHVRPHIDGDRFAKALVTELTHQAKMGESRPLTSLFFGGGTPSLMAPKYVAEVIEAAETLFGFAPDIEITLEANPTSVDADKFKGFASAGVNRLSLGVQSLNDADLARLGRLHSAEEALKAVELARATFPRLSFDLIYARPGQTLKAWEAELNRALSYANDHLSLYQLTIEPNTAYARLYAAGKLVLPEEELAEELYDLTGDVCAKHGLHAYEVSNYAKAGAESRHNLSYWRYDDYVGVGAGAHGRIMVDGEKHATAGFLKPEDWLEKVEKTGHGFETFEALSKADQARELVLMGLRLYEGIDLERVNALEPHAISQENLAHMVAEGFLVLAGQKLKATPKGRLVLNSVLNNVLA